MLSIFEFTSYRRYIAAWIGSQATSGYGVKGRIAEAVGVSASLISQMLKGEKNIFIKNKKAADYLLRKGFEKDLIENALASAGKDEDV